MVRFLLSVYAALFVSACFFAGTAFAEEKPLLYTDPSQPAEVRVDDLIGRMTLEEKATQLVNQARAIPRLGVPDYNWWSEALHGVARAGTATVFPEPIGLAATFDAKAVGDMADVISTEARIKYNQFQRAGKHAIYQGLTFWSPNVNIFRDPRWGRGQETFGEDPYLSGVMGTAFVKGMQGNDPVYLKTVATPKHFAVHSGPEPARHEFDAVISKHDLADTYLPAFRQTIIDGKAESIMCAYNRVNGAPACASEMLLADTLRKSWNFKGYVVSDCDAVADIANTHHYTKTLAEAAAVSLKAGTDSDCASYSTPVTDNSDYQRYIDAVRMGVLKESELDVSLRRLFTARFRLGMFDPPQSVAYNQIPERELDSEAHRELARKLARESLVLLKNDGILPVSDAVRKIVVVGPLADQKPVLYGNYNGTPSHAVSALEGIRAAFPRAEIMFEPGTWFLRPAEIIATDWLSDGAGSGGLKAEFFTSRDFSGTPFVNRHDAMVNYDMDVPADLPPAAEFAVRWSGFITPPKTGDYKLSLGGPAGRLFLDGRNIITVVRKKRSSMSAVVHMEAGHSYAIRLERDYGPRAMTMKLQWTPLLPDSEVRAVDAARKADLVIAVVGITSQLEGEEMSVDVPGFVGGDRTSMDLPHEEELLLRKIKALGKKLAVVLYNGSPLSVNWAAQHADAIVDAWYPGEEGGTAIGEVLSGGYNPGGRLPVTFYRGVDQLPPFESYAMAGRTYRYFTGKPLYPFGYGLSYTRFHYSGLKLSEAKLSAGKNLTVEADVTNTGGCAGDEVVQLYLTFPDVSGAPRKALRGFARLFLKPGERRHVRFVLSPRDLSMVSADGQIIVSPGKYRVSVGGGQPGTTAALVSASLVMTGRIKLPQ